MLPLVLFLKKQVNIYQRRGNNITFLLSKINI